MLNNININTVQCFVPGFLINKRVNPILLYILVLDIPDYMLLHLSLLLCIYCENVEREIYETRPLRDHIGLNVNAIFGVRYTDLRGLPSGILLRKVLSLENDRAKKNSTRCPL